MQFYLSQHRECIAWRCTEAFLLWHGRATSINYVIFIFLFFYDSLCVIALSLSAIGAQAYEAHKLALATTRVAFIYSVASYFLRSKFFRADEKSLEKIRI